MNDFEPHTPQDNKVIAAEQRQVKTEKHIATLRPHPGHTCFEFDLHTGEIQPAKIESVNATYGGGTSKKIMQRDNCLYCTALNKKNALKKFIPMYERLIANGTIVREVVSE